MQKHKLVSIIIPVFNEEKIIIDCLKSLLNGDYDINKLEFIIADGGSNDNTVKEVKDFAKSHPDLTIKILNNPDKIQSVGLNLAIEQANSKSEIIIRADAHSIYPENYIKDCVQTLLSVNADNIGGVMVPVGKTYFQKAVAFCMAHPAGVGDSKFHLGNYSGFVDTVYLGCFPATLFKKIGLFDTSMTTNQDAELNLRIIKSGGKIYLNENLKVKYFPRDSITKLIKQYFRYGQGRCKTVKKHKSFTSIRQVIPPIWVVLSLFFLGLSYFSKLFIIPLAVYLFILFAISLYETIKSRNLSTLLSPLCFVIMHYSWGLGFLSELMKKNSIS